MSHNQTKRPYEKFKIIRKFDAIGWLADSAITLTQLPFHLLLAIFACFSHCFTQLSFDFKNAKYDVFQYEKDDHEDQT